MTPLHHRLPVVRAAFSSAARYAVLAALLALAVPLVAGIVANAPAFAGTTFTVNSAADTDDGNCDAAPDCTLREAINAANANAGADTIAFNIAGGGPYVIQPGSQLPTITEAVLIDGASQTGYAGTPVIVLDGRTGAGGPAGASGLVITAASSEIRALHIKNFTLYGISISTDAADGNWLHGNIIGDNDATGIIVFNGPDNTIIGTNGDGSNDTAERNVIGGNGQSAYIDDGGIAIRDSGTTGTIVTGNYIGVAADGSTAWGNDFVGVAVRQGATNTRIGTNADGTSDVIERNVISANNVGDVLLEDAGTNNNVVAGNYIGLNAAGDGTYEFVYSVGVLVGYGAQYNLIGTNGDGTNDAAERNIISGHLETTGYTGFGVVLAYNGTSHNTVAGNYIGTDPTGTIAMENGTGLLITEGATENLVGTNADGTNDAAEANVISGNLNVGAQITLPSTTNNTIAGNIIGLDASGITPIPNRFYEQPVGIMLGLAQWPAYVAGYGTNGNLIGGTASTAGNLISGNYIGIGLDDSHSNTIQGNQVGGTITVDLNQSPWTGNDFGIVLNNSTHNLVGGSTAGAANVIIHSWNTGLQFAANDPNGVGYAYTSDDNTVQGNFIGTDGTYNDLINEYAYEAVTTAPVVIEEGSNNLIGGTGAGEGNVMLYGYTTVNVKAGTGNAILSNYIRGIIDLNDDGATANDNLDADSGPNDLQNKPTITSFTSDGTDGTVAGTLHAAANETFTVQIFFNNFSYYSNGAYSNCEWRGFGPGDFYVGSETVNTDGSGNGAFGGTYELPVPYIGSVTATATDSNGNTSEFSRCFELDGGANLWVDDDATAPFYGTLSSPFKTIGDALAYASANGLSGATLNILDGTYDEQVIVSLDGLSFKGVHGAANTTVCSSTLPVFDNNGHTGITISGLKFAICP